MTDNVIDFPRKIDAKTFPINIEESFDHIEEVRRNYCDEVSADILEAAFSVLSSYGLTVIPDENVVKSIVFLEEAVKAMVYTTKKLQHPFQELALNVITVTDEARKDLEALLEEKQLTT